MSREYPEPKFKYNDKVKIIEGFYKGQHGHVRSFSHTYSLSEKTVVYYKVKLNDKYICEVFESDLK